ncbi:GNAT family N-acetyltransferase [Chitinimonas sp.]|uniref:GNAT family N-acetyltransferase n=1 Tax=Chitinimonas sp. TaxID=1934313 RepID=UPI0035AE1213
MLVLQTARQTLHCLAEEQLFLLIESPEALACLLGLAVADDLLGAATELALRGKLPRLRRASAANLPWRSYWLVVERASATIIGLAGFRCEPDAEGEVELSYAIAPAWRGAGHASEAGAALIGWAFSQPGCRAICAHGVRQDNAASRAVLARLGLRPIGSNGASADYGLSRAVYAATHGGP